MSNSPVSPITPLDRMKQWVFDKLQKDISIDDPTIDTGPKRESLSGPVPKIIISEENYRSPSLPVRRGIKPSPLKRTWINYDLESPATNISPTGEIKPTPTTPKKTFATSNDKSSPCKSSPTGSLQKTWLNYSPHSPLRYQGTLKKTRSVPASPDDGNRPRSFWSAGCRKDLESPLHKFVINKSVSDSSKNLSMQSPMHDIRFVNEQQNQTGPLDSPTLSDNSFGSAAHLNLNRTLSVWSSDVCSGNQLILKEELRKTGSQNDVQKKLEKELPASFKPLSDKSISLTRSWSINLYPFRLFRNKSLRSEPDRKSSLNESELRQSRERRRSSIFKLLCVDTEEYESDRGKEEEYVGFESGTPPSTCDKIRNESEICPPLGSGGTAYLEKLYKGIPTGGLPSMFNLYKAPSEWGSIKVRFQYFSKSKRFYVSLIRGFNIGYDRHEHLRIFVTLCLMPGKLQRKRGHGYHDTYDPVFYETFHFKKLTLGDLFEKRLRVKFYHKRGLLSRQEPLGEAIVPLFNYDLTAETVSWQHLRRCGGQKVCMIFVTSYLMLNIIDKQTWYLTNRFKCVIKADQGLSYSRLYYTELVHMKIYLH